MSETELKVVLNWTMVQAIFRLKGTGCEEAVKILKEHWNCQEMQQSILTEPILTQLAQSILKILDHAESCHEKRG